MSVIIMIVALIIGALTFVKVCTGNNPFLIYVTALCTIVFSLAFTYWVADSALPDWFKFWLLK